MIAGGSIGETITFLNRSPIPELAGESDTRMKLSIVNTDAKYKLSDHKSNHGYLENVYS